MFRYTFEEAGAARKIQAAWAGLKGRRAYREQLAKQSIRGLGIACINEASSHAWVGHEEVRKGVRREQRELTSWNLVHRQH